MRTVLIIDDEINICHLVQHLIEWDKLNLECMGVVTNSNEAYDIAMEKRPDIIITDIQMPGMTGLELIEKLQGNGLKCKFVIFTGYKTFDYAYKAIKFGCNDFLLKPINKTELNDSLSQLCQSFQANGASISQNAAQNPRIVLRRQLLNNIAHGEIPRKIETLDHLNAHFSYDFKDALLRTGILWLSRGSFPESFRMNLLHKLARVFQQQARPLCHEFEMVNNQGDILFIMNYSEGPINDALTGFITKAAALIEPYPFLHYVLGLGELFSTPQQIIRSYDSARQAIASRIVYGYNRIIDAASAVLQTKSAEPPLSIATWKEINLALDILDKQRLSSAILLLCQQAAGYLNQNPAMAIDWYRSTAHTIYNKFVENHTDYQLMAQQHQALLFSSIESCMDIGSLTSFLTDSFMSIIDQYLNEKKVNDTKTIQTAKTYICENFYRQLELDDVATQVYLSPTYFGILFKKETGTTFTNYLFEKRMEKAKEYLQELKYGISEIANMIGYKDTKYFSRQFKKYYGINPVQYRKIHHFQYKG